MLKHVLVNPGAPEIPGYKCRYHVDDGDESRDIYTTNSVTYVPPAVPVLL